MTSKKGFTMIEMLLSMTFVAFLMITVALTTISMMNTYERGVILSQVNSAGRSIMTDMQRAVSQAPVRQHQTEVSHTPNTICFGNYSYVWNTGAKLAADSPTLVKYIGSSDTASDYVRLAKVEDPSMSLCSDNHPVTQVDRSKAVELLPSDSSDGTSYGGIAIQNKIIAEQLASNSKQVLYRVSFILGTNDQSALDKSNPDKFAQAPSCRVPSEIDLSYCAVNKFDFLIRAGGGQYDSTS